MKKLIRIVLIIAVMGSLFWLFHRDPQITVTDPMVKSYREADK